ncbi:putative short chain dehydrogenase/reductase [Cryomyces antarcticus]
MTGIVNYHGFDLSDLPKLTGKIAVITGGQAGIGREITAQLLLHGIAKVYILARSEGKYIDAKEEWTRKTSLSMSEIEKKTEFISCNLSDIKDVQKAASSLLRKCSRCDILIHNAALPMVPKYTLSPQGIDEVFATNHIGHFVLTNILLPLLERTAAEHGTARIVVTSSMLHLACQNLDLNLLTSPTGIKSPTFVDSAWRYARSKLANILFTRELTRLLQKRGSSKVYANVYYPGNIPTEAMDAWKEMLGNLGGAVVKGLFKWIGQTTADAATTALFLAASKDVEDRDLRGRYFIPIATEGKITTIAQDKDLAKNLWYWSERKVAETLGEGWQEVDEADG